jgi:hypothetical protein
MRTILNQKLFLLFSMVILLLFACKNTVEVSGNCCDGPPNDKDNDYIIDGDYIEQMYRDNGDTLSETKRQEAIHSGKYDTLIDCSVCQ